MRKLQLKSQKARQNPALVLGGLFGLSGLVASVAAWYLKDSTQETLKTVVPPLLGGSTGYLAGDSLKLDKNSKIAATVLGLSIGYLAGRAIENKKQKDYCSEWSLFKPSCWSVASGTAKTVQTDQIPDLVHATDSQLEAFDENRIGQKQSV